MDKGFKDLYALLDIPPTASSEEIKTAYRKQVKKFHPDKDPEKNVDRRYFHEIVAAYDVLSDKRKKMAYDEERKFVSRYKIKVPPQPDLNWLLQETNDLLAFLSRRDRYMINQSRFQEYVSQLYNPDHLHLLGGADAEMSKVLDPAVFQVIRQLPDKMFRDYYQIIFTSNHKDVYEKQYKVQIRLNQWHRYKVGIIFLIAFLLVLLMVFLFPGLKR